MRTTRRDFVKKLFVATAQLALVGPLLPHGLFANEADRSGLNFLVLGDWGRKGQKDQLDVAQQMGIAAKKISPSFVISAGDNFYEHGVTSVDDEHFYASFENVYNAPSLQVPWYVVLGNHDYCGSCQAQIDYSKKSQRWQMPSRYYLRTERLSVDATVDFVFIDTNPFLAKYATDPYIGKEFATQNRKTQLEWIEQTLAKSTATWKIVIGHHPIYSGGEHGDTPELVTELLPLLERYGVQVYLCGHDHDLQHLQAGTLNFFCAGAGSTVRTAKKVKASKFAKAQPGFLAASLRPNAMDIRLIAGTGEVLYAYTVSVKST
jgi:acid phosphatase